MKVKLFWEVVVATASSNPILSGDKFTAWQRWHPGALQSDAAPRRTAESEEAMKRHAHAAGFEEGKRAGFAAGIAQGRAHVQAEADHIARVAHAANDALQALGDTLSQKTVRLAVAIAEKLFMREIEAHPEALVDLVRDALNLLPDTAERVRIVVNYADVELIRRHLSDSANLPDAVVTGSNEVKRGGCHLLSPSGEVDATLDTRIARVVEVLGAASDATSER